MQKIDRLGWAAGTCFVSFGVRLGLRVNEPEVLERIPQFLPPGFRPATSAQVDYLFSLRVGGKTPHKNLQRYHLLYSGTARRARSKDLDHVLERLAANLRLNVAAAARRRVFVHAGVVGWRGRAIVLPGHSFSGKTTLVAELVKAGATYYSDEFAVFDERGRVHPFAKPLSMRSSSGNQIEPCTAEALGGRAGVKPLAVALIALAEFRPGARWRPRRLSMGRATMALVPHTVPVRLEPQRALTTLGSVLQRASVLKGARGEAGDVARALLDQVEQIEVPTS